MELTKKGQLSPPLQLNYFDVRKAHLCLKALDHPIRQHIIEAIEVLEHLATSKEIANHLKTEQFVVSKHLTILSRANLVVSQKNKANKLVFSINQAMLDKAIKLVTTISTYQL